MGAMERIGSEEYKKMGKVIQMAKTKRGTKNGSRIGQKTGGQRKNQTPNCRHP